MNPGIYHDVPNATYHASEGISASTIARFGTAGSPHKFRTQAGPQSKEIDLGTLLHHYAVDRMNDLPDGWTVKPTEIGGKAWHGNRNECKAWVAENADKTILTSGDVDRVRIAADSLLSHSKAGPIFGAVEEREVSVYAHLEGVKELVKCRPDLLWRKDDGTVDIFDLKKTVDATPKGFGKQAANLHYHSKAAWYLDVCKAAGLNAVRFWWICCELPEKGETPEIGLYWLDDGSPEIEHGREQMRSWLNEYIGCLHGERWPMSADVPRPLELPGWAMR